MYVSIYQYLNSETYVSTGAWGAVRYCRELGLPLAGTRDLPATHGTGRFRVCACRSCLFRQVVGGVRGDFSANFDVMYRICVLTYPWAKSAQPMEPVNPRLRKAGC